jgi:hypothetical protein
VNRYLKEGEEMADNSRGIKVEMPQELHRGVYSNNMMVAHTREEFIMDYLMVGPSANILTARIIVSPGHMKRIFKAMQENISKYEQKFGKIQTAEAHRDEVTFQ